MKSNSDPINITTPISVVTAPWMTGGRLCSNAIIVLRLWLPTDVKNP